MRRHVFVVASLVWFFGLAYGSNRFAPAFAGKASWRMLDGTSALTMWGIAIGLIEGQV